MSISEGQHNVTALTDDQHELLRQIKLANERGYRTHTCRLIWRDGRKQVVTSPPGEWQDRAQESDQHALERVKRGCNAYLVHCPASGVTLHDGDAPDEWTRIRKALGVDAHVKSANGGLHWYSRDVTHNSELKTVKTAFGPGSYFKKNGDTVRYVGELPPKDTLPVTASQNGHSAPVTESPTDAFFAPRAVSRDEAIDKAKRMVNELREVTYTQETGFRYRLMGAALYLGGLLHTGAFSVDQAYDGLVNACEAVFGAADEDDRKWIEQGLCDGERKPIMVADSDPKAANKFDELFQSRDQLRDMPRPEPLIDGVLFQRTVWSVIGRDQTYKTFLLLDWLLCMAMGEPWNGREVTRCKVLLVVGEGAYGLHDRIAAWEQHNSVKVDPEWFVVRVLPVNLYKDGADVEHLRAYVRDHEIGVAAFDTLQRNSSGAERNSDTHAGMTVDTLASIARATTMGCAGWVAHTQRADEDTRGSSAWEDDLDIVWQLKAPNGAITATQTKNKFAAQCEPIELSTVTAPTGETDDKGRDVTSLVLALGTGPAARVDPERPPDDVEIGDDVEGYSKSGATLIRRVAGFMAHNTVGGAGRSRAEVAKWLGRDVKDGSVRNAWDALLNMGAITPDRGAGATGRHHWIPQSERE